MQPIDEINEFYSRPDPWDYNSNPDDQLRSDMLLSELPALPYKRVLDIGCGNAFLTSRLPGEEIHGVDVSPKAIEWARKRCLDQRFKFHVLSIFELTPALIGKFDLIVLTGVLYPQYIGSALSLIQLKLDELMEPGCIIAHAHIIDWIPYGLCYDRISLTVYKYREYDHILEIYRNDTDIS